MDVLTPTFFDKHGNPFDSGMKKLYEANMLVLIKHFHSSKTNVNFLVSYAQDVINILHTL